MKNVQVNFFTVIIGAIISFGIVSIVFGEIQWGIIAGLIVGVGGNKWLRVKRQEANDEVEYDERVNINVKHTTVQTFAFSNLLLLMYLIVTDQILNQHNMKATYLILYLSITFIIAFFIVPVFVRKK